VLPDSQTHLPGALPEDRFHPVPAALRSQPRILHLVTTLRRGGTEGLVLTLAREQRRLGCQVEVAVLTEPAAAAEDFTAAGFKIHTLGLRHKLSPGAWWRLRRLLRAAGPPLPLPTRSRVSRPA